jgi:hypothetical protein
MTEQRKAFLDAMEEKGWDDWTEWDAGMFAIGWQAARASQQVPEWLPIETAPKDGTEIILARGPRVTSGSWYEEEPYIKERRDMDGNYIDQDESDGLAFWMSADGGFADDEPPTHWMPLPAAPSAQSTDQQG